MSGLNILLVEDHDDLRDSMVSFLEQEGFSVIGLSCAEDMDDAPTARMPDIYVLDLNLPGEDGLSLAKRLRRARPEAGIVITTARSRLDDRIRGYENGADLYLPKPVDPTELCVVLRTLSARIASRRKEPSGITIHPDLLLLRGPAAECRLSASEVRLLVAMAAAREQTLERAQVAAHLSPGDEDISADSLQNRLSQLRKKLEHCGAPGHSLKSIRSVGYRLTVPVSVH
jgi:DNA-binding response OmpR family regulator